jgi:hypothetical protein
MKKAANSGTTAGPWKLRAKAGHRPHELGQLEVVGSGVAGHFHRFPGDPDSPQIRLPTFVPFEDKNSAPAACPRGTKSHPERR